MLKSLIQSTNNSGWSSTLDAYREAAQITPCKPEPAKPWKLGWVKNLGSEQQQAERCRDQGQDDRKVESRVRQAGTAGHSLSGSGQWFKNEDGQNCQKSDITLWRRSGKIKNWMLFWQIQSNLKAFGLPCEFSDVFPLSINVSFSFI